MRKNAFLNKLLLPSSSLLNTSCIGEHLLQEPLRLNFLLRVKPAEIACTKSKASYDVVNSRRKCVHVLCWGKDGVSRVPPDKQ